jgi:hypothetical protein
MMNKSMKAEERSGFSLQFHSGRHLQRNRCRQEISYPFAGVPRDGGLLVCRAADSGARAKRGNAGPSYPH